MVGIPAGIFVMGSPPGEPGRFNSQGPQHDDLRAYVSQFDRIGNVEVK
jgi:formylglycine-generating enzyme required for sulfatase activity